MKTPRDRVDGPVALLLLAVAVLHSRALTLPFWADDFLFLDVVRRHPGWAAFAAADPFGNYFRPISRAVWFGALVPLTAESSFAFHLANLVLLGLVVLLFVNLARSVLAGSSASPPAARVGAVAGGAFLALHFAFDVPVMWVSGSQDLLALAFALGALVHALGGRAAWSAPVLLLGLLSKETVAPCALILIGLARARGEAWQPVLRRTAPMLAVTAVWAVAWAFVRARGGTSGSPLGFAADYPLAALAHLGQVALGLEFREVGPPTIGVASLVAVLCAVLATLWAARAGGSLPLKGRGGRAAEERVVPVRALLGGLAWALLATVPVVPVVPLWSDYFYGFALCGVALSLAATCAALPVRRGALAAVVVAALGLLSAQARSIDAFADGVGAWTAHSHRNRHYLDRAMALQTQLVRDLKASYPTLLPGSTLFFGGIPSFCCFQLDDGPLVRWAYRDRTLHSHFISEFRAARARGSVRVLFYDGSRLVAVESATLIAELGAVLVELDRLEGARDAFRIAADREPASATEIRLWLPWVERALAPDSSSAGAKAPAQDPRADEALAAARAALAAGDSAAAFHSLEAVVQAGTLDPRPHAMFADLLATVPARQESALNEAFVARTLAPYDPTSWRRWALLLAKRGRNEAALPAIARWRTLAGPGATDPELERIEARLQAWRPGGALAREALRRDGTR